MIRLLITLFFILVSLSFAKNYNLFLGLDKKSSKYLTEIKKETKKLFPSDDSISYQVKICEKCDVKRSGVYLFKNKKLKSKKNNSYIVNYNLISSNYDKNKTIRATALAIYEYLKENKHKTINIKNNALLVSPIKKEKELEVLDLDRVLELINTNNLAIKRNKNTLELEKVGVSQTKSLYKPQIDVFSNYVEIDRDRAKASRGLNPQRTLEAGVKLKQLIYSNKVLKNIEIKKLLYKSTNQEVKALNDELFYKAVLIYLNIIKSQKYEQIIKMKYDFIKKNLYFAQERVDVGVTDNSDVYRWQNELANANIELTSAKKQLNRLKIELFNLLRVKDEYSFLEYDLNSKLFKLLNKDAIMYLKDKKIQNTFTKELVFAHPRLKQLNELIKVKNKQYKMNKQSYYLPTLAFEGTAKKILKRGGEGSQLPRTWDDEEYQAVLNLTLPLYEGGVKSSNIQKNQIELIDIKLQYNEVKNLIIENVEKNYDSLIQSYKNITYSKDSLNASKKNLELIEDKYKNGESNIISLLDAQNSFILSNLNLNISNIEYLIDLSSIYFFSGKIDILIDKDKKKNIEKQIQYILKDKN